MVADNSAGAERLNLALHRDTADALAQLQQKTGLKKVDIVNRAIQLYGFIDHETRSGRDLIIRDAPDPTGETPPREQFVKLFF